MDGNIFLDANVIYDAGTKAMSGSKFKYATQLFEMNHLLYTAMLQQSLLDGSYTPSEGNKFQSVSAENPDTSPATQWLIRPSTT